MSDSSQIGNAERSAAVFYYKNKLNENQDNIIRHENDPYIQNWRKKKGDYITERAEIYEKLAELKEYDKPVDTISAQVTDDLVLWGLDADVEGRHVRRVLAKKFKREYDNTNRTFVRTEPNEIQETIKVLSGKQLLETLDSDDLRNVHKLAKVLKEHTEFVADTKGVALVDHQEREEKVSTFKPVPGKSEVYYAIGEVLEQAEAFVQNLKGVLNKAYEYPPTKDEREDATKIRSLVILLEPLNKFLRSCKDEKFSFSLWEHAKGAVLRETISKHGAAVKMKVPILDKDGKPALDKNGQPRFRVMTRERMGDEEEEILQWMQDMTAAMKSYAFWMGFADWRDINSEMNGRIASRKDRLHGKLSDASIG